MTHPCARSSGEGPAPRNSSMGHEGPATHGWIIQPKFHLPIRQTLRLDSWQHSRGTYQLAAQIINRRLRPKHWQQYKQIQPELACRQGIWPARRNALTTASGKFTVDPRVLCLVQHRDRRPNEAWSPLLHKRKALRATRRHSDGRFCKVKATGAHRKPRTCLADRMPTRPDNQACRNLITHKAPRPSGPAPGRAYTRRLHWLSAQSLLPSQTAC